MTRSTRTVRHWTLGVAAALMAAQTLSAQQPPAPTQTPTFRSTTRLIVRNVTVRDKDGTIIEGLTASDFVT